MKILLLGATERTAWGCNDTFQEIPAWFRWFIKNSNSGELEQSILLSADLMQRISLPIIYRMKQAGKLPLDGYALDLYTIEEVELATA